MNIILDIKNLIKSYKHNVALKDINLQFEMGKVYGLIGTNGSGKTTLIKSILGFIHYCGEIIKSRDLSISYVPEIIKSYDYLTGLQTVKLITQIQGFDLQETTKRFQDNSPKINYYDEEKLIKQHSKGNLRKLMLLQVFSINTDLMLLDEPFSGLDPLATEKIKDLFLEKKVHGTTILLSTHQFEIAKSICDELIFIKNGIVIEKIKKDNFNSIRLSDIFG